MHWQPFPPFKHKCQGDMLQSHTDFLLRNFGFKGSVIQYVWDTFYEIFCLKNLILFLDPLEPFKIHLESFATPRTQSEIHLKFQESFDPFQEFVKPFQGSLNSFWTTLFLWHKFSNKTKMVVCKYFTCLKYKQIKHCCWKSVEIFSVFFLPWFSNL